ncbi:MAG: hypothetical protein AABW80_03095, partial [Nanoarchaeota archaeon]
HEDLGSTTPLDRDYTLIGDYLESTALSIGGDRLAYVSKKNIFLYSFNDKSKTEFKNPFDKSFSNIDLDSDYLAYTFLEEDYSYPIYLYNFKTGDSTFVDDMTWKGEGGYLSFLYLGAIDVEDGFLVYPLGERYDFVKNKMVLSLWVYDIAKNEKTKLNGEWIGSVLPAIIEDNKVYYNDKTAVTNSDMGAMTIYDLNTKAYQTKSLPGFYLLLDVKDNSVIYSTVQSKVYRVYNLETDTYFDLYSKTVDGVSKELQSSTIFQTKSISKPNFVISFIPSLRHAKFGEGIIFYEDESTISSSSDILIYNYSANSIDQLTLRSEVIGFDSNKDNIVCFISEIDFKVKCHEYSPNNDYELPSQIDTFNSKVIGGYDFT